MFRRTIRVSTAILAVALLAVVGCGGGGHGGAAGNTNTGGGTGNGGGNTGGNGGGTVITEPIVLPVQQSNATFTTQNNRPMIQQIGDLKITVPAGTFAKPATVTLTRYTPTNLLQASGFTPAENAGCEIRANRQPLGAITIESVASARIQRDAGKILWLFLQRTADATWSIINDLNDQIKMTINPSAFSVSGIVDGIVGHFLIETPDAATGLVLLATDPTGNKYSAMVFVHGFNDKAEDFQLAADKFSQYKGGMIDRPRAFYSFAYDYRQHCADSAQALAEQLDNLPFANISITAHSAGAVVVRDMIENKRCHHTNIVGSTNLVNGASLGSFWADRAGLVKWLEEDVINNHPTSAKSLLATLDDPVVADLAQNGSYLHGLNTANHPRQVSGAYLLIGGTLDAVVGPDSGYGTGIPFETMLTGTVNRRLLTVDHSSLVKTSAGLDWLLETIYTGQGAFFNVITAPENYDNGGDSGWDYDIVLNNHGDVAVNIDDIAIDCYDADNVWTIRRWVASDGRLVPGYTRCDIYVPPCSSPRLTIHEPVDNIGTSMYQVPDNLRWRTHQIATRYTVNGRQLYWPAVVHLVFYGDLRPGQLPSWLLSRLRP